MLILCVGLLFIFGFVFHVPTTAKSHNYGTDAYIQKYLEKAGVERALVFIKQHQVYRVHYPFNAPFPGQRIYAKDKQEQNRRLAEHFQEYQYFIVDNDDITEVTIDEL